MNNLKDQIKSANRRLYLKLMDIDPATLNISGYSRWYIGTQINDIGAIIQRLSDILFLCLSFYFKFKNISLGSFVFMDYGGGLGIMSLLAKEIGVGKVIYNDIYDLVYKDAIYIARLVGNEADFYLNADIDETIYFLKANKISLNAVASYDVIEHIHNIEYFFKKLPDLSMGPMVITMASSANTFNWFIRKKLMKQHLNFEYHDREKRYEEEDPRSFRVKRRELIEDFLRMAAVSTSDPELDLLVLNTRGLNKEEILAVLAAYLKTGKLPRTIDHPTNTCDPYSGMWEENLLDPFRLARILDNAGFDTNVTCGYYYSKASDSLVIKFIKFLLNKHINRLSNRLSLSTSPFYIITGVRL
jgi:hypothetical protein